VKLKTAGNEELRGPFRSYDIVRMVNFGLRGRSWSMTFKINVIYYPYLHGRLIISIIERP
jgi:hypothetical protein